jgi:hypothetical protein
MTTLASRVDNFPEAWRPEPGDKLVGEVVDLTTTDGGFGEYVIVTVLVEDESTEQGNPIGLSDERTWHAFDTVAKNEIAKQKPRIGDGIAAKFFGKRPGKDGTEYKAWRVLVEHRGPANEPTPAEKAAGDQAEESPPDTAELSGEVADDDIPW